MSSPPPFENGPSDPRDAAHSKEFCRAAVRGAAHGAIVGAIPALGFFTLVVLFDPGHPAKIWDLASAVVIVIAFCTALSAFSSVVTAANGRPVRKAAAHGPDFNTAAGERAHSFSSRMARYLDDTENAGKPLSSPARSRMAFFSLVTSAERFAPKPAAYIRKVLERIHRLLHGDHGGNGGRNG